MSLANHQYDAIMRRYNQIQLKNKRIADMHYQEVCEKVPEFNELALKEADLALHYGKLILAGHENASEQLEAALNEIKFKRAELLEAYGYPKNYTEIQFDCDICQDTGYTKDMKPCTCFKKAAVSLLYDQSAKQDLYKKENFNNFSLDYYSDTATDPNSGKTMRELAKEAYCKCMCFAENFDTSWSNLVICGPTGVGKSFLANCIAKELIDSIHSVIHMDAPSFFKVLADYHFRSNDDTTSLPAIYDCDCLIVDDLGAELVNNFVVSSLCECVERRRMAKKATIFTTNLLPSELKEKYQDRTFSRLIADYTFIRLDGDDIRLLKKNL